MRTNNSKSRKESNKKYRGMRGMQQSFNYAEIPYDASIFSLCRFRGDDGGPSDYYDFSA
ncbi:uncharacterized protein METZ01_LOCUS425460 [marine metagenome]|uniref:Uncharacterized protein n=1 Tax=marine metagenome TaxID=408172 RepID=A0A382XNF9_9ZZZZ